MRLRVSRRATALGCVTAAIAAGFSVLAPTAAQATAAGADGYLTGLRLGTLSFTTLDTATGATKTLPQWVSEPAWSRDGSRTATQVTGSPGLQVTRYDGSRSTQLDIPTGRSDMRQPAFTPDGRFVVFTSGGASGKLPQLFRVTSDGSQYPTPLLAQDSGYCDEQPTVSDLYQIAFTRKVSTPQGCTGIPSLVVLDPRTGEQRTLIDNADRPDFSPDGSKIIFTRTVDGTAKLFTVDAADGQNLTEVPTGGPAANPSWSPSGERIAFQRGNDTYIYDVATGESKLALGNLVNPAWQPRNKDYVFRVWGDTAIDTSVASSVFNYADANDPSTDVNKAQVAVLARGDAWYDGLAGSALAGSKNGPMLLTPPNSLTPSVSAELARTLKPGSTVYVLGGVNALSPTIESQVRSLGLVPKRLAGDTLIETAAAIAREMTSAPKSIVLATGANYYDALAAGAAAAAAQDSVVLLTAGDQLTPATVNYLNSINPTQTAVVTVGGPADRALNSAYLNWPDGSPYYRIVGTTAVDTAAALASFWYTAPRSAAVATATTWQDALTGGALIAGWGPVLLTDPTGMSSATAQYLEDESASLSSAVLVGGPDALRAGIADQAGRAISVDYAYQPMPGGLPQTTSARTFGPQAAAAAEPPGRRTPETVMPGAENGPHTQGAERRTLG